MTERQRVFQFVFWFLVFIMINIVYHQWGLRSWVYGIVNLLSALMMMGAAYTIGEMAGREKKE